MTDKEIEVVGRRLAQLIDIQCGGGISNDPENAAWDSPEQHPHAHEPWQEDYRRVARALIDALDAHRAGK